MFQVVQCKCPKYGNMTEDGIFKERDKVIACQLIIELPGPSADNIENLGDIPLVDIILNIDLFTSSFEDRNKVLRIIKELFNHCTTMKKLLLKHGKRILEKLIDKYDKQCHLYVNAVTSGKNSKNTT